MPASTRIIGLPALNAVLAKKAAALAAANAAAVALEVKAIEADARGHAALNTGELRAKIDSSSKGAQGEVRAKARHAGFNEFGTSKMAAQPFMGPAADGARVRFVGRVARATRKAVS